MFSGSTISCSSPLLVAFHTSPARSVASDHLTCSSRRSGSRRAQLYRNSVEGVVAGAAHAVDQSGRLLRGENPHRGAAALGLPPRAARVD
jgi:hypothetical protein